MPTTEKDAKIEQDSSTGSDANGGDSSTRQDDKPAESMLDVLKKTMDKHVEATSGNDDKDKEKEAESESTVNTDDEPEDEEPEGEEEEDNEGRAKAGEE